MEFAEVEKTLQPVFALFREINASLISSWWLTILVGLLLCFFGVRIFSTSAFWFAALVGGAVGLLVPLLAAIYPITVGTRITVREAISDTGVGKGKFGASLIDRLLGQHQREIDEQKQSQTDALAQAQAKQVLS